MHVHPLAAVRREPNVLASALLISALNCTPGKVPPSAAPPATPTPSTQQARVQIQGATPAASFDLSTPAPARGPVVLAAAIKTHERAVMLPGKVLFRNTTFLVNTAGKVSASLGFRAYHPEAGQSVVDTTQVEHSWHEPDGVVRSGRQSYVYSVSPAGQLQQGPIWRTHKDATEAPPNVSEQVAGYTLLEFDRHDGQPAEFIVLNEQLQEVVREVWPVTHTDPSAWLCESCKPSPKVFIRTNEFTRIVSLGIAKTAIKPKTITLPGRFISESRHFERMLFHENGYFVTYDFGAVERGRWPVGEPTRESYFLPTGHWRSPTQLAVDMATGIRLLVEGEKAPRIIHQDPTRTLGHNLNEDGCLIADFRWHWDHIVGPLKVKDLCSNQAVQQLASGFAADEVSNAHPRSLSPRWMNGKHLLVGTQRDEFAWLDASKTPPQERRFRKAGDELLRLDRGAEHGVIVSWLQQGYWWLDLTTGSYHPLFSAVRRMKVTESAFVHRGLLWVIGDSEYDWSQSRRGGTTPDPAFAAVFDTQQGRLTQTKFARCTTPENCEDITLAADATAFEVIGPYDTSLPGYAVSLWRPWLTAGALEPQPVAKRSRNGASPDLAWLAPKQLKVTGGRNRTLTIDDVEESDPITSLPIESVATSGDGRVIAALSEGGEIAVVLRAKFARLAQLQLPRPMERGELALDFKGELLSVATGDGAYLFDVRRGTWLYVVLLEKDGQVEPYIEHEQGWLSLGPLAREAAQAGAGSEPQANIEQAQVPDLLARFIAEARENK